MCQLDEMFNHPAVGALRDREKQKYAPKYFTEDYWREDLPGLSGNRGLSYEDPEHRERFSFLYDTIIKTNIPRQLLDAGCGPGFLLEQALSHSINAQGLDVSLAAEDFFRGRTQNAWSTHFTVGSISQIPFSDKAFDLSLCLDTLEHLIVFDIFAAVQELCRVSSANLICSINLDNPYEFHPTILSRDSWIAIFESTSIVRYQGSSAEALNKSVRTKYPEYDFFVFHRI